MTKNDARKSFWAERARAFAFLTAHADPQKTGAVAIAASLAENKAEAVFVQKQKAVFQTLTLPEDADSIVPRKDDWHITRDFEAILATL